MEKFLPADRHAMSFTSSIFMFQYRTLRSKLPDINQCPSELKDRFMITFLCPLKTITFRDGSSLAKSHNRTVLSALPVARNLPPGLNARVRIKPLCPVSTTRV